jgi:hypothetical protein
MRHEPRSKPAGTGTRKLLGDDDLVEGVTRMAALLGEAVD